MNQQQQKIMKAAFELFREKGYEASTTREIAARAGIQKGLLYYYFRKKEDIVFLWYRSFLDTIYRNVQSGTKDHLLSLITFLFVYYRTLASDSLALELICCVLTHHDLTRRKIDYTTDFYHEVLPQHSRESFLTVNAMMIGGESQLLPMIIDHEVSMTLSVFAEKFIRNFLNFFKISDEQKNRLYAEAYEKAGQYSAEDYRKFIYFYL